MIYRSTKCRDVDEGTGSYDVFLKKQLFKRDLMMTETNPVQQEIDTIYYK